MVKLVELLEKLKTTPVDLRVLEKKLPKNCRAVQYKSLKGKHRSEVFKGVEALVVHVPKRDSKVGHFIALIPRKHHIEYFSSLGGSAESELDKLGESLAVMKALLGKNYIYNSTKLQSGKYSINSCASWILCRLYLRKLKLRQFTNIFKRKTTLQNSDDIAAIMSLLLLLDV